MRHLVVPPRLRGVRPPDAPVVFEGLEARQLMSIAPVVAAAEAAALDVRFSPEGLESLTYDGHTLAEAGADLPGFQVRSFTLRKPDGSLVRGQEVPTRSYDAAARTLTLGFSWGTVTAQLTSSRARLAFNLKVVNTSASDTVAGLDILAAAFEPPAGAVVTPTRMQFDDVRISAVGSDDATQASFARPGGRGTPVRLMVRYRPVSAGPSAQRALSPGRSAEFYAAMRFGRPAPPRAAAQAMGLLPAPLDVPRPADVTTLPEGFDPFAPPLASASEALPAGAPAIAEYTRTAGPGQTVVLTGAALLGGGGFGGSGAAAASFFTFGQTAEAGGSLVLQSAAAGTAAAEDRGALILDARLPERSMYFVWPRAADGTVGRPVAVNRTEAWWVGPDEVAAGQVTSIYGRNLSHDGGTEQAWVYLRRIGSEASGRWARVTSVNPYKVDFVVPAGLKPGRYEVWAHNGHGGEYGWSVPVRLRVTAAAAAAAAAATFREVINVRTDARLARRAVGDGVTDDYEALRAAADLARSIPGGATIYLPAGTYLVSHGFAASSNVTWAGDGRDLTTIRTTPDFSDAFTEGGDWRNFFLFFANEQTAADDIEFRDMSIVAPGGAFHLRGHDGVRLTNLFVDARGSTSADLNASRHVFITDSVLVHRQLFLGDAEQVFIDGADLYGAHDANALVTLWGAEQVSITRSTGRNLDASSPDGWAQGRFVVVQAAWGSTRDLYLGDNATHDLAIRPDHPDPNQGEQILFETCTTPLVGKATKISGRTVRLPGIARTFADAPRGPTEYELAVTDGRGVGQHRRIVAYDAATETVTLDRPWAVEPDGHSTLAVLGSVTRGVVYGNSLDGLGDYATRVTASTGVLAWGNALDLVVASNTIQQVRWGLAAQSLHFGRPFSSGPFQVNFFNAYVDNVVRDAVTGIVAGVYSEAPDGDPDFGPMYLGNLFRGNTIEGLAGQAALLRAPRGASQVQLAVFEGNLVRGSIGGSIGGGIGTAAVSVGFAYDAGAGRFVVTDSGGSFDAALGIERENRLVAA